MRPFILSALLLAAATPAFAQMPPPAGDVRDEHRDDRDHRGDTRGQRPADRAPDQGQRPAGVRPDQARPDQGQRPDDRGGYRGGDQRGNDRGYQNQRGDDRGYQNQRGDDRGYQNRGGDAYRGGDRGYRGGDHGYRGDDRGYRGGDHGFGDDRRRYGDGDRFARFHGDAFYYPRGYGYRYFGIGAFLPRVFWDQRYYIADPYAYRLPPAFAGTHWVRYGPDALMVRNYDGRIVRVIRGLFY